MPDPIKPNSLPQTHSSLPVHQKNDAQPTSSAAKKTTSSAEDTSVIGYLPESSSSTPTESSPDIGKPSLPSPDINPPLTKEEFIALIHQVADLYNQILLTPENAIALSQLATAAGISITPELANKIQSYLQSQGINSREQFYALIDKAVAEFITPDGKLSESFISSSKKIISDPNTANLPKSGKKDAAGNDPITNMFAFLLLLFQIQSENFLTEQRGMIASFKAAMTELQKKANEMRSGAWSSMATSITGNVISGIGSGVSFFAAGVPAKAQAIQGIGKSIGDALSSGASTISSLSQANITQIEGMKEEFSFSQQAYQTHRDSNKQAQESFLQMLQQITQSESSLHSRIAGNI